MKILHDAFDLACLRIKPLSEYNYPLWQVWAVLAGVALAAAVTADELHTDLFNRTIFFVAILGTQCLVIAKFFNVWLRLKFGADKKAVSNWDGKGSLVVILVLIQCIDFLQPLILWFDDSLQQNLRILFMSYGLILLIVALARSTATSVKMVVAGLLLSSPVLGLIGISFLSFSANLGWIDLTKEGLPAPPAVEVKAPNIPKQSF